MSKPNRILIAEDDEMVRRIIKEVLQDDYELYFAEDGSEALQLAEKHKPDLLLLDIMMPEKNGFEVCRELRKDEEMQKLIIIMVTALSDKDSEKMGLKAGADDFITKPFNPIDLRTKVSLMFRLKDRLLSD